MRSRRLALAGAALVAGLAAAGCARLEHPTAVPSPSVSLPAGEGVYEKAPSPSPSPTPAQAAGGVCTLLDYDSVERATGTRFQVAAASRTDGARGCALQVLYSDYPDLVLAVAGTKADAKAFSKAAPSGASKVSGLGSAAYSRVVAGSGDAGPAIEVGWLGRNHDIVTLRYTYPPSAGTDTANAAVNDLVTYAKRLEARR